MSNPVTGPGIMTEAVDAPDLAQRLIRLCKEVSAKQEVGGKTWVYLDRLWREVDRRSQFVDIATEYLKLLLDKDSGVSGGYRDVVVVSPDTISSSYGSAPVVFSAAERIGVRVAIWEEHGEIPGNRPRMIGTEAGDLHVVVLQDVVRHAGTAVRMLDALKDRNWYLNAYACFVLNPWDSARLERMGAEYSMKVYAGLKGRANVPLRIRYLVRADADL